MHTCILYKCNAQVGRFSGFLQSFLPIIDTCTVEADSHEVLSNLPFLRQFCLPFGGLEGSHFLKRGHKYVCIKL